MAGTSAHRILCYGDSLTAGFCYHGSKFIPYAKTLQAQLRSALNSEVEVDHYGFSGWTAEEMLSSSQAKELEDFTGSRGPGLATALKSRSYSLLIFMAGTNDIGTGRKAEVVFTDLKNLMMFAQASHTRVLNIGIPDTKQKGPDWLNTRRQTVNTLLARHADMDNKWLTFLPCPVTSSNPEYFDTDGLHFSPEGYAALGVSLTEGVCKILQDL